ncbi:unnamed protein product [Phytomonas sp. Hart1]|nr:unnamed protein product [Phytomonas sp. Hart1]|eukprot:CCW67214.1 unnamed protein product [Phytomonas sp. isolate Hart1]
MSIYCCVANPILFLKALVMVGLERDSWVTITFSKNEVELHVEANNRNTTATALLPRGIFSEYVVVETRLCVHLHTLLDAFFLLGLPALGAPTVRLTLVHPTPDGRLLVELGGSHDGAEAGRTLQSQLLTRPVRARPLDLRFSDLPLVAAAAPPGEALRDALLDLAATQSGETTLAMGGAEGVRLRGRGPHGNVEIVLPCQVGNDLKREAFRPAWTRVQTLQFALACGCGRATFALGGGAGGSGLSASLGAYGCGAGLVGSGGAGFEQLSLQINSQRQLSVVHESSEGMAKVTVRVVLNSLRSCDEF